MSKDVSADAFVGAVAWNERAMSREGFLKSIVDEEVFKGPGGLMDGCLPFEVLVSFGEVAGSSELSEALFLAMGPEAKRVCELACWTRLCADWENNVGDGGVTNSSSSSSTSVGDPG